MQRCLVVHDSVLLIPMPTPTPLSESASLPSDREPTVTVPERLYAWKVATNLGASFRYAAQGIYYAFVTQRNFRIHALVTIVVISAGVVLSLPRVEIAVLGLTCGAVMTLELINTALEAVVDLTVKQTYHDLAKIAKDCAAGAVLVAALIAILVGGCLLLPPFFASLGLFII